LAKKCKENDSGATSLSEEVTATEGELRPLKVMEEASLNCSTTQHKVSSMFKYNVFVMEHIEAMSVLCIPTSLATEH
jgi:hypothetical protein